MHFLTCFVALTIARILEMKLERKHSIGTILDSLSKASCSLVQQNYYLFDYYDEVLKNIGKVVEIGFSKRLRTLGEIKKIWQIPKSRNFPMKKWQNDKPSKPCICWPKGHFLLTFPAKVRLIIAENRRFCLKISYKTSKI